MNVLDGTLKQVDRTYQVFVFCSLDYSHCNTKDQQPVVRYNMICHGSRACEVKSLRVHQMLSQVAPAQVEGKFHSMFSEWEVKICSLLENRQKGSHWSGATDVRILTLPVHASA